jgi:phosphoribosylanthranilate isomerase
MLVKICGITSEAAAHTALEAGADFIGFVFAESKRKISPEDTAKISSTLPASIKKVGVFVNETKENMIAIAETAGLDVIQLHGDEPAALAKELPYEVIKAFQAKKESIHTIGAYPCDYYLLDSPIGAYRGGNGTAFDWELVSKANIDPDKIILAGGLSPDNVQEAIATAKPAGVDVSSGVETDGSKDLTKIRQFVKNAKQENAQSLKG